MENQSVDEGARRLDEAVLGPTGRSVTIKHLAAALGLSITTISRALNGYSDVGAETRQRVRDAARRMGYRPNRNAQRLVLQKSHTLAWVQSDNDRKFVDPHFVEVLAGVLRGARAGHYDVVLTSETPERELAAYDRYVNDNSVDGFIVDLPREHDPRVEYLRAMQRPFVVHGRTADPTDYGWVDIDNYGTFYRLTRLLLANGHRRIAFINGDERYAYALFRRRGVMDAIADAGGDLADVAISTALHPMGGAGFELTARALADEAVTAVLFSSALMAVEGQAAIIRSGRSLAVATIDDELHFIDLAAYRGRWTFARSSLRDAGEALIAGLIRQCESGAPGQGTLIETRFEVPAGLDDSALHLPLSPHRSGTAATA